jgi:hypothetical protein
LPIENWTPAVAACSAPATIASAQPSWPMRAFRPTLSGSFVALRRQCSCDQNGAGSE